MAEFKVRHAPLTYGGITKGSRVSPSVNNTDVIAPEFKLYIEGVQVPFESISVSQYYMGLPTADIQIPPESGLLDITRGYEPKVHIFYKDDNYEGFRLLFWGHIKSNSYSRSRGQGNTSISFHCEHKNSLLNQLTMDFTGWTTPGTTNQNEAQAVAKPDAFNSQAMVIEAMTGLSGVASASQDITDTNTAANIASAPTNLLGVEIGPMFDRLQGMPGVILNLWNQIKKGAYVNRLNSLALNRMYIPLVEQGLSFFKRMSGHTFLESRLQTDKKPFCHRPGMKESQVIVAPCDRMSMTSAVQRELSYSNLNSLINFSGELTSFRQIMEGFLIHSKYDLITLASPAEINLKPSTFVEELNVAGVEKVAIETIVKPQIPFYYSPVCNVILPRTYMSIQVNQNDSSIPTRMSASHDMTPGGNGADSLKLTFNSPPSIREAIAYNAMLRGVNTVVDLNLGTTKGHSFSIPGRHEQGTGIRPYKIGLPWWLVVIASDKNKEGKKSNTEEAPVKGTDYYNDMMALSAEWRSRYGTKIVQQDDNLTVSKNLSKNNLNPFDPLNKSALPHEKLLFSTMDYEYSQKVSESRSGAVESVFNPYIIPGYPMDVIDDSPNHPSFHGFCTSVTHTITSRSVVTNIGMIEVCTYAELSNYYTPSVAPFLQSTLNLVTATIDEDLYANTGVGDHSPFTPNSSTILQNPRAKATADQFYREVLGVGAAAPDDMIHFSSGRSYPLERVSGTLRPRVLPGVGSMPNLARGKPVSRELDDYYTTVGNLRLVSRPIESLESISFKFDYNFINLDPDLYNSNYMNYVNPQLASNLLLEPGASLFLDYLEVDEFIKSVT